MSLHNANHNANAPLDVRALARSGGVVSASMPLSRLSRLSEGTAPLPDDPPISWEAQGQLRTPPGGEEQVWLRLRVRGEVPLVCQRCMDVVRVALDIDRWFRFAPDEAQAQVWDEECDEDVLVCGPDFKLLELVEDEALLSLPLVPRHDVCPTEPRLHVEDADFSAEPDTPQAHPFAGLAALRSKSSG